ncbi:MAG: T9SS type A sorting domain-containing protein [Bacteroidota bacterium]
MLVFVLFAIPLSAQVSREQIAPSAEIGKDGDSLLSSSTASDRQLVLTVSNRCSFSRSEALLQWNAEEFTGQIKKYTLERSRADSIWWTINGVPAPTDSFLFVEQPYYPAQPEYRYRLTASTLTGEQFTAYSDTVRMQYGAYIDLLDLILPYIYDVNEITYEHRRFVRLPWPYGNQDETVTVVMTFLFSTIRSDGSWEYPIRKTVIAPSGERQSWMTYLVREPGIEKNFSYIDSSGNDFGYYYLGFSRFFRAKDGEYFTSKAGLLPSDRAGIVSSDSLVFDSKYMHPWYGETIFSFVCTPLGGRGVIKEMTASYYNLLHHMRLIKSVNSVESQQGVPSTLTLSPAYPNPFSASTVVNYSLVTAATVRLTLHDMLGREIRVLDEGVRSPGNYSVTLFSLNLPAGTYICRMQAGREAMSRTLVHFR